MPTLYFYNGLAQSHHYILRLLLQNHKNINANGLKYFCFTSNDPRYGILSHQRLYDIFDDDIQVPLWIKNRVLDRMSFVDTAAEKEENFLFSFTALKTMPLLKLISFLRSRTALAKYRFAVVLSIGHQSLLLEQWNRISNSYAGAKGLFDKLALSEFVSLDRMVNTLCRVLGRENVFVVKQDSASPLPEPLSPSLLHSFTQALQIPEPEQLPAGIGGRLYLQSRECREFFYLCTHGGNSWPGYNATLLQALEQLEKEHFWDTKWITPPDELGSIAKLAENGNRNLAQAYFNSDRLFSFFPREEQSIENTQWIAYAGLQKNDMERMASMLSEELRYSIAERLLADSPVLLEKQKELREILLPLSTLRTAPRRKLLARPPAKVSVLTLTYNHEKYIAQNIESILSQKTDFPVEHIIADDASSDRTRSIIMEYAEKYDSIKPVFIARRSLFGEALRAMFSRARSEFVSICEGDDYFIDDNKLQQQVNFLEGNPDCALCFHPVSVVFDDSPLQSRIYPPPEELPGGVRTFYTLEDLFILNFIQTNSVMYRWRFRKGLPSWFNPNLIPGDWYWHLLHAEMGKIGFIQATMSAYRRHRSSLFYEAEKSHVKNRVRNGLRELETYSCVNTHFKGKFARDILVLSSGVFTDLLQHAIETDDDSYFVQACDRYPELALDFLKKIKH